jgi:choline dehydrogenase
MQPGLIDEEAFPGPEVQTDEQILEVMQRANSTLYHAAATCVMGRTNDTNAVVDSKARVIGVNKPRMVDASVFPFLPPGHPMATVCKLMHFFLFEVSFFQ